MNYMDISQFTSLVLLAFVSQSALANTVIDHNIDAEIFPSQNRIVVTDTLTGLKKLDNQGSNNRTLTFSLHKSSRLDISPSGIKIIKQDNGPQNTRVSINKYQITLPADIDKLTLSYELNIHYPVEQASEEYDRRVSDSPGIISDKGVYLANESFWFAVFNNELVTFTLSLSLPKDWKSVSQGARLKQDIVHNKRVEIWQEKNPQDDIYLVAARFIEYEQMAGRIKAMAFLRTKDDGLAQKYLDTTAQYLQMYQNFLGPYPYAKFALVENFWESGWGMPSFTLLGPQVIRFPFILHSSYPHELLHNWWGNSVYMDWEQGNWAEGLTTYLADHLVSEQRGKGADYRRAALQKYTDYTQSGKDFALKDFVSRTDSTTQAVGYGKTMMFFHMLRVNLGDELFSKALAHFYKEYQYKEASFSDIKTAFSAVAKQDLAPLFAQWVGRVGAPIIKLSSVEVVEKTKNSYQLNLKLLQTQTGTAYKLLVPVVVSLQGEEKAQTKWIEFSKKEQKIELEFTKKPQRVDIDPSFDIFRRLDLNEIPPALSQMFGAGSSLIILPKNASADLKKAYQGLAKNWQNTRQSEISIVSDGDIKSLPGDKAVWVLGWENKFRSQVIKALANYDVTTDKTSLKFNDELLNTKQSSVIVVGRNPTNPRHGLALISADIPQALPGLARKLPHYGRYSYLAFEGKEPINQTKGQWPVVGSPLSRKLQQHAELAELEKPNALATLSPVF